jgi:hypothetical protein
MAHHKFRRKHIVKQRRIYQWSDHPIIVRAMTLDNANRTDTRSGHRCVALADRG